MKMIEIKEGARTIYKHVPDDWTPEDEKHKDITGDLTTSERRTMGYTDIPEEKWNKIFKKGKSMKVLSLFDGIACGRLAFERAGIPVEKYYASEIDKYAIQVAQKNFPDIIEVGDVTKLNFEDYKDVDIIIGGSPCQDLSIVKQNREGLHGERSRLFWDYVKALSIIKPKYFLLENVASMKNDDRDAITSVLRSIYPETECIMINSALVSAQQRKRYYWTNWHNTQPEDRGIILGDIIEGALADREKSRSVISSIGRTTNREFFKKHQGQLAFEPICVNIPEPVVVRKYSVDIEKLKILLRSHKNKTNKEIADSLSVPVTKVEHWFRTDNCFAIPDPEIWFALKDLLHIETDEFDASITEFETKDAVYEKAQRKYHIDGKMSTLTTSTNDEIIAPQRIGQIGKGGQGDRIYSVRGKSVSLNANGGGRCAKTGLYKIDLPDGDYMIRKLTPVECERLQTLPDGYTEGISNTQRYKAIGNGWTVDVIAHILKGLK